MEFINFCEERCVFYDREQVKKEEVKEEVKQEVKEQDKPSKSIAEYISSLYVHL